MIPFLQISGQGGGSDANTVAETNYAWRVSSLNRAVGLLAAGVDVRVIRRWLGRAHLDTTKLYAQASLEVERKALEQVEDKLRPANSLVGSAMPIYWLGSIRSEAGINVK